MQFKPGDIVDFEGKTFTLRANPDSTRYPLLAGRYSFTTDGCHLERCGTRLTMLTPAPTPTAPSISTAPSIRSSVTNYPLGQVQTLEDGTQIYHPINGQPFQLIPTHKGLL